MKFSLKVLVWVSASLFSHSLYAAELLVNTFLQNRPFKGVEVELNGSLVGETGALGEASAPITAGKHKVQFLKNGIPLANYAFSVGAGESAELSATFTDFSTPPEFTLSKFDENASPGGQGETGTIGGEVRGPDGQPVAGASVSVLEAEVETATGPNGAFELALPRGVYTLVVSHPDYDRLERADLRVVANIGLATNIKLAPLVPGETGGVPALSASADEEVVVMGAYKPTENATDLEKFSVAITDAISIDDLLRFGDSDVAATLKRLVGVSVTDGRYAVVRGLDGRYIAATLNGNLMPSTDPFRRDVQLDLFPSDILGGIEIQKTFSSDLPGDTTGGIIKISTRGMPDGYVNSLSGSLGYTTGVTGDDFITYRGSGSDGFGYDDGLRELPGLVRRVTNNGTTNVTICQVQGQQDCVEQPVAAAAASALPNIYNSRTESAGPDFDISYTLGNLFDLSAGTLGLYGTASYGQSSESDQDAFVDSTTRLADRQRSTRNTTLNGYLFAGYEAAAGWEVSSRTIVLRDTEDRTTTEVGTDKVEDQGLNETILNWIEREFIAQQFEGVQRFFNDSHELTWRAGLSQTSRYAPDRRSYNYRGPVLDVGSVQRSYSDLTEDGLDLGLDYEIPFDAGKWFGNVRLGALGNTRERDVELVRVGFQVIASRAPALDQNIEDILVPVNFEEDRIRLRNLTASTDSYTADQESVAAYLSTELNYGSEWTAIVGVRQDDYSVDVEYPNSNTAVPTELESNELLPSLALVYRPTESVQLRFGYSNTVSRPNITEISQSRFFDENDRLYIGGCQSTTQTECLPSLIDNFDIRAEYYFGDNDSISIALFDKQIDDPLEITIPAASGSAAGALAFSNGKEATVSGVEIDLNKSFLEWQNYSMEVGANMSFIDSETTLTDAAAQQEGTTKRDLQGQSPFLANLQISLDHFPTDQKFTLLVNYFDDRIDRVARGQLGNIMEAGRATLNFNYEKGLTPASTLKLKIQNLLDEEIEFTQDGRVVESWKEGVSFSLGYSWDFAI